MRVANQRCSCRRVRIEVEDAAVFFRQAAVPVVADAGGQRERRRICHLSCTIRAELVGAVVAVGIALQERLT